VCVDADLDDLHRPSCLAFRWTAAMMCQLWPDATDGDG
jgi:hypothetical protein